MDREADPIAGVRRQNRRREKRQRRRAGPFGHREHARNSSICVLKSAASMGKRDPRVDAYIAKSADFAKPILTYIRDTVHAACPDVEEEMKWSFPHFTHEGILCSMASFKEHCAFGFWKGSLILG